jgi:hypothetical protein
MFGRHKSESWVTVASELFDDDVFDMMVTTTKQATNIDVNNDKCPSTCMMVSQLFARYVVWKCFASCL